MKRLVIILACTVLMLCGCAATRGNKTPSTTPPSQPPGSEETFDTVVSQLTAEMADEAWSTLDRYVTMRQEIVYSAIVENDEWSAEDLSHELGNTITEKIQAELGKKAPRVRFIQPFASYGEVSTDRQFGQCSFRCGTPLIPDYNFTVQSFLKSKDLHVKISCRRIGSPEVVSGFPVSRAVSLNDKERALNTAYTLANTPEMPPSYPGMFRNPFPTVELAGEFMAKVLCCASQEVLKTQQILGEDMHVALPPMRTGSGRSLTPSLVVGITQSFRNSLRSCCPDLPNVASEDEAIALVETLSPIGIIDYDTKGHMETLFRAPTILLFGEISQVPRSGIAKVMLSGFWFVDGKRGDSVNTFSQQFYFKLP